MSDFVRYHDSSLLSDFQKFFTEHQQGLIHGFHGASFAQFLTEVQSMTKRLLVIVVEDQKQAAKLSDEILFFQPTAQLQTLIPFDVLPYYGLSPHPHVQAQTIKVLFNLIADVPDYLIVPQKALWRRHLPRELYDTLMVKLVTGFTIDRTALIHSLEVLGYERSPIVEEVGQFAVRGDVIDVYSPQQDCPVRMSFFDRELESIRHFDVATQRTADELHHVTFIPMREVVLSYFKKGRIEDDVILVPDVIKTEWKSDLKSRTDALHLPKAKRDQIEDFIHHGIYFHGVESFLPLFYRKTATLFDYLPKDSLFISDIASSLETSANAFLQELVEHRKKSDHIETIIAPEELCMTADEVGANLCVRPQRDGATHGSPPTGDNKKFSFYQNESVIDFTTETRPTYMGKTESNQVLRTRLTAQISKIHNLAPLASELNHKRTQGITCFIVCPSSSQVERVRDLLARFDLPVAITSSSGESLHGADSRLVHVIEGGLHEGFYDPQAKRWWISDEEIFGKKTRRAPRAQQKTSVFSSFSEISEGDYIIHMDHGIGVYRGLVKLDFDVNQNDFLLIEYLGADKLYVPVDKLNRVQRFVAEEGSVPQLDKLGGVTWSKVRQKAKRAARKLAAELLKIQARREAQIGYAFQPHHEEMLEFASSFEFEETPDQEHAIAEVLRDMGRDKPMDRLVCGDVGFGKTEIAIRAAYKAILDKKQVAVLVPTTVLAFQHHTNFKKRFDSYAVRVELLSRFRSAAEQNAIIKKLQRGEVDIVIGTHRLLSQDIKFADLGLLIIDEEHRFGVLHKEKIKKIKNLVDVMTLTATPIPRTLNFALNGIRDLSIINTPPVDRLAIKTYACSFDEVTLRDAMMKELKRGGQIYFVHNRVQTIEKMTKQVSDIVPEARVHFAHGQMGEDDLERIMIDFTNHDFDILVCTTIIESGLDIPNANTMIVNRADHMGLAQLYQLRGRVGRSHHQAYCYLVVPDEELINAKAVKRLAAIQKFTELGSGFKIASHDLEIRGAGNILGDEQSGQIAAIGYDLYIHLLKEAIAELNNQALPEDFAPEVSLNVAAKIPETFIPDSATRLILYKELSASETVTEVDEKKEEWLDRFGVLPQEVVQLFQLIRIRILCKDLLVSSLKYSGGRLLVVFHAQHKVETQILTDAIQKNPKVFSITRDGAFVVTRTFPTPTEMLAWVLEFLWKLTQTL